MVIRAVAFDFGPTLVDEEKDASIPLESRPEQGPGWSHGSSIRIEQLRTRQIRTGTHFTAAGSACEQNGAIVQKGGTLLVSASIQGGTCRGSDGQRTRRTDCTRRSGDRSITVSKGHDETGWAYTTYVRV